MRTPIRPVQCEHEMVPLQSHKLTFPPSWVCALIVVQRYMNANHYKKNEL